MSGRSKDLKSAARADGMVGNASKAHRLFFSLWPHDELRDEIALRTRFSVARSGGRVVPAANFHLTVLFLGEVFESRIRAVMTAAEAVRANAFSLQLDEIQAWPGANVLCLTPRHAPLELSDLANQLYIELLTQQFKRDRQDYRPHLTLVRDLPHSMGVEAIGPLPWQVSEFVLVDSVPTARGSLYTVIGRWPLQMASSDKTS